MFIDKFPHPIDIDECTEGGHNCSTTQCCVDTIGGFVCQCREGFEPTNDGLDCVGMYVGVYVRNTILYSRTCTIYNEVSNGLIYYTIQFNNTLPLHMPHDT